ncbi:MAG: hypothetical protein HEP71_05265 [Roseivirga sp.]|nr:hypothetical protein [Roseivirga sp.]
MKELKKEVHRKHRLYRLKATLIGRRQDNDDILIELEDGRIAVVHLTWTSGREKGPWPLTHIYQNKREFWEQAMKQDISEWIS